MQDMISSLTKLKPLFSKKNKKVLTSFLKAALKITVEKNTYLKEQILNYSKSLEADKHTQ